MLFNVKTRSCDLALNADCQRYNFRLVTPPTNPPGKKAYLDSYCPLNIVYTQNDLNTMNTLNQNSAMSGFSDLKDLLYFAISTAVSEFKDNFTGYQQNIKDLLVGFLLNFDWNNLNSTASAMNSVTGMNGMNQ
jgi:hypothetical protein